MVNAEIHEFLQHQRRRRLGAGEDLGAVVADMLVLAVTAGASAVSLNRAGSSIRPGMAESGHRRPGPGQRHAILAFGADPVHAQLCHTAKSCGVDFNAKKPPRYADFAYLSVTIGMTFQVADTDLTTDAIRYTVLRQALLSYGLGPVVLATVINLVSGLLHWGPSPSRVA